MTATSNPRADQSPIYERPKLALPDGARTVVWPIVNIELWDFQAPMARTVLPTPQGRPVIPDVTNYGWFDYGMRVGLWRIKRVLDRMQIRATASVNAAVCDVHPALVQSTVDSEWELLAHGYEQRVINVESDERAVIRRTLDRLEQFSGRRPRGWMGPGLAETLDTPDVLAAEGVEYCCDWCNDDQPYPMKVAEGSLIALPYTVELNDITIFAVQHHSSPELARRACDAFDTLYAESEDSARVMAIALHPYITGAAHRTRYLEEALTYIAGHDGVVFWTGEEILDWYAAQAPAGAARAAS